MGVYKKAVITNAGRALMARSIAGEIVMQFSRAVTSSHIYPSDTDFKGYTSLEGIQQTVIPSNVQVVNDTLISVRGLFGNESVSESYLIQNIGLYATDGINEILFSVSQATTPDEMPAYNGVAPSSFIYTIQNAVLQASSLSITINPAGTATIQDIVDLDGAKLDADGDISETVVETLEPIPIADKFPIPSAGDKIKSFFGKIITFLKNIKPLEADVTYYVATTGSDTTGDGTNIKPFKTVQHAVDILPKDLGGHTATINVAGGTYNDDVYISGFYSSTGRIMIYLSDNVVIRGLIASGSHVVINSSDSIPHNLTVQYILAQDTATLNIWAQINLTTTGYIIDQITTTSKVSIIVTRNSTLYLSGVTTITGNDGTGVFVVNASCAYIDTINGNGLNVGMHAVTGSNICIRYNSISAVSPYAQTNCGSFMYGNGTQISNIISSGLSCTWGIIRGGYFRHGNTIGTAVVTVNLYITTTAVLTTGAQYTIYGFPRPLDTNDIAVFCAEKYFEHAWLFAPDGTIKVIPGVNVPTNTVVLLSTTYLTNS